MYCNRNCDLIDFSALELPVQVDFVSTLGHVRDSATGADGIPYSAYKANVDISAQVFSNHMGHLSGNSQFVIYMLVFL